MLTHVIEQFQLGEHISDKDKTREVVMAGISCTFMLTYIHIPKYAIAFIKERAIHEQGDHLHKIFRKINLNKLF